MRNGSSSTVSSELTGPYANSWQWNGFIYGPVYSSLIVPNENLSEVDQQEIVDTIGTKVDHGNFDEIFSLEK